MHGGVWSRKRSLVGYGHLLDVVFMQSGDNSPYLEYSLVHKLIWIHDCDQVTSAALDCP